MLQGCVIKLQQWLTQRAELIYTQPCMQPNIFHQVSHKRVLVNSFVLEPKDKQVFYTFNKKLG